MRALLIDSDKSFVQSLIFFMKSKGFSVDSAANGDDGTDLAKLYDYDIILSEVLLPDKNGTELLRRIRNAGIKTPVIMISELSGVPHKVACLTAGADDYVVKPCDKNELLARVQAVIRRSRGFADSVVRIGDMLVNLDAKLVSVGGKTLHLTGKEYALVELLCLRQGTPVSKEQFLNHLYGGIDEPEIKIIDVFLCRIRQKIMRLTGGRQYIHTVWGRGYILKDS